jgi:hypothetical protein
MAITIGTASFPTLTAQPFGYDETDARAGLTAQRWSIQGLLKPSEWLALNNVYTTWRASRIQDDDSLASGTVGTTIAFSGKGAGGITWTNVACWFASAPSAEQSGAYLSASVELVDANQALAVLLRAEEKSSGVEDLPDFGTITIGSTVVTLTKPVDAYAAGPTLELTAIGNHYINGPLVVYKIKDVEGTTDLTGWNDIRSWYESQIIATPSVGSYFPITAPTATAEKRVVSGVKTTVYTVSIQLGLVR